MLLLQILIAFTGARFASALSTNYEYYTSGGIKSGLSTNQQPHFLLNEKNVFIYSGSIHYFRVPRAYWRDRIRKLRALGFNTVETYIPWNLHEPEQGRYDFGNGGSDMEDFLHLEEFIQLAMEEDLFMIIRPGPFINSEFEFGGFPSWLLRVGATKMRRSDKNYMSYVTTWFNVLMPLLAKYQFTRGGPIIAFQVENEYGNTGGKDKQYLIELRQLFVDNGIVELLATSDNPWRGTTGTLPEYFLMTGNFNTNGTGNFNYLELYQPGKPKLAMEFWSGWFDLWGQHHVTKRVNDFTQVYTEILTYPGSANIYMFIGGTNFAFVSGSSSLATREFAPITTSYDYDALLAENGDYTQKYYAAKDLLSKYGRNPEVITPNMPELIPRVAYLNITVSQEIKLSSILSSLPSEERFNISTMEFLNVNDGNGQRHGYIVYSKVNLNLTANSVLKISQSISDTLIVLVNGKRINPVLQTTVDLDNFEAWNRGNKTLTLNDKDLYNATLDLIVENWGRRSSGSYTQYKGVVNGEISINGQNIHNWKHSALEFNKVWLSSLCQWKDITNFEENLNEPTLFKSILTISESPRDTYIYMENWTKGLVVINGFVLGRYSKMGPQQALYLPAPFLKQGDNEIVVFEHYKANHQIEFTSNQIYGIH